MSKMLYIRWFKSPAQLCKFVCKNKIKNIVAITRNADDKLELWFRYRNVKKLKELQGE